MDRKLFKCVPKGSKNPFQAFAVARKLNLGRKYSAGGYQQAIEVLGYQTIWNWIFRVFVRAGATFLSAWL